MNVKQLVSCALTFSVLFFPRAGQCELMAASDHVITFVEGEIDSEVRYSTTQWSATREGLRETELPHSDGFDKLWVETHKVPIQASRENPHRGFLKLTLEGTFENAWIFPTEVFVRYSADGKHWTSWQALVNLDAEKNTAWVHPRSYEARVAVPLPERQQFDKYREEWMKGSNADVKELVPWILKKDPTFFSRHIPFVGFVQLRIEGSSHSKHPAVLRKAVLRYSWAEGSFRKLFK